MTYVNLGLATIGAGLLGAGGLYLGYRLSHYRRHRKSDEVQTLFARHNTEWDRD